MKTAITILIFLVISAGAVAQPLIVTDTDTNAAGNYIASIVGFPDNEQHTGVLGLSWAGVGIHGASDQGIGVRAASNTGVALDVRGAIRAGHVQGNILRLIDPDTGAVVAEFEFEIIINNKQ